MSETVLYDYKAGIRYAYTMTLIVGSAVGGWFWFVAYKFWYAVFNERETHIAEYVGLGIVTILPAVYLGYVISRRPRSFLLIRKDDGLFLRWRSGREVRVVSTKTELSSFILDKDYGNPYGICVVKTETRRGRTRLCFHREGEAYAFADVLARQKGR